MKQASCVVVATDETASTFANGAAAAAAAAIPDGVGSAHNILHGQDIDSQLHLTTAEG